MNALLFKDFFLKEEYEEEIANLDEELLVEEVSANTKGVIHELLVGYHLNGKKHMEKHPDISGDSPKQAHDKLKKTVTPSEYSMMNKRAEAAASDIKKRIKGKITAVHWTSKPGDLERSTGIPATQKQDASDIVVTAGKKHHGISLKVTDKNKQVPVSNPGIESTHGGEKILETHRKGILKKYPALGKAKNKEERKAIVAANPKMDADIKNKNKKVLSDIADHMHKQLTSMPHQDLVKHLRDNVLHAHKTPMEEKGHIHIRHTAHGDSNFTFSHASPGSDHEHILKDPKNISIHKQGTGVVFKYKGKPFAKHRIKFSSQSDPLSSIKGSGEAL